RPIDALSPGFTYTSSTIALVPVPARPGKRHGTSIGLARTGTIDTSTPRHLFADGGEMLARQDAACNGKDFAILNADVMFVKPRELLKQLCHALRIDGPKL